MNDYCPSGKCHCQLLFIYHWIIRMLKQKTEALSDINRYYFLEKYPNKELSDEELMRYYADPESGGAKNFAEKEAFKIFDPVI
jgi:hypothetical protein